MKNRKIKFDELNHIKVRCGYQTFYFVGVGRKNMRMLNWDIFSNKFHSSETKNFEYLAYLLFCSKFDIEDGIFRYKNHPGIETEPILHDNFLIGHQVKYFKDRIDDKQINESLSIAKENYPLLQKVYLYVKGEFSQAKRSGGKKPKNQTNVENHAKELGLEIEWQCDSHLEQQLSLPKNKHIADYFFSINQGAIELQNTFYVKRNSLFYNIHSDISWKDKKIKLDRSKFMSKISEALCSNDVLIIYGEGGTGKTAIIKDWIHSDAILYIFKATALSEITINQDFTDFMKLHDQLSIKYFIIDSAEKLADIDNERAFELISLLHKEKWKIIFTVRPHYLRDLQVIMLERFRENALSIEIPVIEDEILQELSVKNEFPLPEHARVRELIRIPFYLDFYLKCLDDNSKKFSIQKFKDHLWSQRIQNDNDKKNGKNIERGRIFCELAKARSEQGIYFISPLLHNWSGEILSLLEADGIIHLDHDNGSYFIAHDIYEEWALDKILRSQYTRFANSIEFFTQIGSSLPIRRAFRVWLTEILLDSRDTAKDFINLSLKNSTIPSFWKDEIIIAILLSPHSDIFFEHYSKELSENNFMLLKKVIFLLRTACRGPNDNVLIDKYLDEDEIADLNLFFTKPIGCGWGACIKFIYEQINDISLESMEFILPLLCDWNASQKIGITTRQAGLIALYFYQIYDENEEKYKLNFKTINFIQILLTGTHELKGELQAIFSDTIVNKKIDKKNKNYELIEIILSKPFRAVDCINALPEAVLLLMDAFWYVPRTEDPNGLWGYSRDSIEIDWALPNKYTFEFFPASAYRTPIWFLLKTKPFETIGFIIHFVNRAIEHYVNKIGSDKIDTITLHFHSGQTTTQYVTHELWNTFRGTSIMPCLLQSIHMALERFLLENAKNGDKNIISRILILLLRLSRSGSITAIVTSVVNAYPEKFFSIAKILFSDPKVCIYDLNRSISERRRSMGVGHSIEDRFYEQEREESNKCKHREKHFEQTMLCYQFFTEEGTSESEFIKKKQDIFDILDKYWIPLMGQSVDDTLRFSYARLDSRKMQLTVEAQDDGSKVIKFNPEINDDLKNLEEQTRQETDERYKYTPLFLWANSKIEGKSPAQYAEKFDSTPQIAFSEIKKIILRVPSS